MVECVLCEKGKKSKGTSSFMTNYVFQETKKTYCPLPQHYFYAVCAYFCMGSLSDVGLYYGRMKIA